MFWKGEQNRNRVGRNGVINAGGEDRKDREAVKSMGLFDAEGMLRRKVG